MTRGGSAIIGPSDDQIRALLERYRCPVPFHEVRTRFLGNIASPIMAASPLETVKGLWGGELPEFDDLDAVNELMGALVQVRGSSCARAVKRASGRDASTDLCS